MDLSHSRIAIIQTSPPAETRPAPFAPIADNTVLCCFFSSDTDRDAFLRILRDAAGQGARLADTHAHTHEEATAECAALFGSGDEVEAVTAAVAWRAQALNLGYHTYRFKQGYGPYRSACMIAFKELTPAIARENRDAALAVLGRRRDRLADQFGLTGGGTL